VVVLFWRGGVVEPAIAAQSTVVGLDRDLAARVRTGPFASALEGRRSRQAGIACGIIVIMAMTLRLDEQETDALRRRAAREGRSMQDVARQAVRDYIDRTSKRELLDDVLDEEIPRYAEALRRLGE
jgi:hypothetical protein